MRAGILAAWHDPADRPVGSIRDVRGRILQDRWDQLAAIRDEHVAACRQWRDAAFDDGWEVRPTYAHESVDTAWTATRDGYKVQGISRPARASREGGPRDLLPTASVTIWGPDRMQIAPMPTYSWEAIVAAGQTCMECEASPVETHLVGFAGRYCEPCATRLRPQIEHPGWCD